MTEAEWERSVELQPLLRFLAGRMSARKFQLFAVGCCRRQWDIFRPVPDRQTVNVAERYADGKAPEDELRSAAESALQLARDWARLPADRGPAEAAYCTAMCGLEWPSNFAASAAGRVSWAAEVQRGERGQWSNDPLSQDYGQIRLLYDIAGNPFARTGLDPAWLTATVTALAARLYQARDFGAMPILADALQDAGCDSDDILAHCRDATQPHCRGCWVVDLILGKE